MAELTDVDHGPTVLNVIFTPHTVQPLMPFAWSLLRMPDVRVRLVVNGCGAAEQQLLEALATLDDRFALYRIPTDTIWRHGWALDHLLDVFDEPHFWFIDSDIIALCSHAPLVMPLNVDAAWGDAPPIWWSDAPLPRLGTTYVAVYRRAAVRALRVATGVGFGRVLWDDIAPALRAELDAAGLRLADYDTGKLLNALLMARGHATGVLDCSRLLHLGQFSSVVRTATVANGVVRVETRDPRWWLGQVWFGVRHRQLRGTMRRALPRVGKQWMTVYFDALLRAIAAEQPLPVLPWFIRGARRRRTAAATAALVTLHRDFKAASRRA